MIGFSEERRCSTRSKHQETGCRPALRRRESVRSQRRVARSTGNLQPQHPRLHAGEPHPHQRHAGRERSPAHRRVPDVDSSDRAASRRAAVEHQAAEGRRAKRDCSSMRLPTITYAAGPIGRRRAAASSSSNAPSTLPTSAKASARFTWMSALRGHPSTARR